LIVGWDQTGRSDILDGFIEEIRKAGISHAVVVGRDTPGIKFDSLYPLRAMRRTLEDFHTKMHWTDCIKMQSGCCGFDLQAGFAE
jgi:hypothetical protein